MPIDPMSDETAAIPLKGGKADRMSAETGLGNHARKTRMFL